MARRKDRLDGLVQKLSNKKGKFYPVKADVTKEEDVINAFKWVKENLGPIHILVNSAGVFGQTSLVDGDSEIWKNTLDVNVLGLSIATREAVRDMRANNVDGHIIHINSVVGHQVTETPNANLYPASKFAVTALAETLRLELLSLKLKIKITVNVYVLQIIIGAQKSRNELFIKKLFDISYPGAFAIFSNFILKIHNQ